MLFGLISGTYSSIFIATALFIEIEAKSLGKKQKVKKVYHDDLVERKVEGVN